MSQKKHSEAIGGLLLIGIGALILTGKFVDFDVIPNFEFLVLPVIGGLFMLGGIMTRNQGLMVPGGIISGIGWGAYLVAGPLAGQSDEQLSGIFLLAFAAGWASITVVSALFAKKTVWGTLVPAAVLGAIGGALLFGGVFMDALELAGQLWPLALIAAGAAIILKAARRDGKVEQVKA